MSKKATKVTDKELENLQAKISTINDLQYKIGSSEIAKNNLLQSYNVAKLGLRDMQVELKEKYGHVSIDVTDGSLTEIKEADEQTDKKD
tara:strand:- start:2208 stop:2474 length:267 start_codon:yes stop_codon:yes gene_type:complete